MIYVETSVWSYAFADDAPESRVATLRFFDSARAGRLELFVSDVVLAEFARAAPTTGEQLHRLVREFEPEFLELTDEAEALSRKFIEMGAMPPAKVEDAQHVAIAVVNELDFLVSWNYRHLVNARRRDAFQHISAMSGYYKPLHIAAPPEVTDDG
jgi:predicted nucleic acid-binding protein